MKKFFLPALIFLFAVHSVTAQRNDLMLKSSEKGLFLEHKVSAKENFFALGRMYNVHPRSIASYNKIDYNKGLVIGQLLRIPLTDTNFTQKGNSGTPLYYKAGENENLSKISSVYKNVSIDNLRNWNSVSGDNVKSGTKLIVGFLQSKEFPSTTIAAKSGKEEAPERVGELPPGTTPAQQQQVAAFVQEGEETKVVKEEPKVIKEEPSKSEPVFAKQDEKAGNAGDSYFKYHFEQQVRKSPVSKDQAATGGIFKTTSGWLDNKYYLLMDGVQPGTIIKITNPSNNIIIYAKVLGQMAGIRQNEGFDIRISSAAASALQITEQDKFIVKVNY